MTRLALSSTGQSDFERLLGHNPSILEKWAELEQVFLESKSFSPVLKEQVRRVLAFGNGCEY